MKIQVKGKRKGNANAGKSRLSEEQLQNRIKALDMRRDGATYEEIGKHFKVSTKCAWDWIQKSLQVYVDTRLESAGKLRALEIRRLDKLYRELEQQKKVVTIKKKNGKIKKIKPDPILVQHAIKGQLKILEQKRRYVVGLEVPKEFKAGLDEGTLAVMAETERTLQNKLTKLAEE